MAYVLWPSLSGGVGKVLTLFRGGVATPTTGSKVTAEQAQDAELVLARYKAQGADDPAYKLIAAGLKTLAEP